jgi:hypothetical protein
MIHFLIPVGIAGFVTTICWAFDSEVHTRRVSNERQAGHKGNDAVILEHSLTQVLRQVTSRVGIIAITQLRIMRAAKRRARWRKEDMVVLSAAHSLTKATLHRRQQHVLAAPPIWMSSASTVAPSRRNASGRLGMLIALCFISFWRPSDHVPPSGVDGGDLSRRGPEARG